MPSNFKWIRIAFSKEELTSVLGKGGITSINAGGKTICIVYDEGTLHALGNRCPHAGGSLGEGWCDGKGNVVCPVHRITYNLKTGRSVSGEGFNVETYPVEIRPDGIWLAIRENRWFPFW